MSALTAGQVVGVIGAGTMGAGIAQVAAAHGHRVLLLDSSADTAAAALARISEQLGRRVEQGRLDAGQAADIVGRIELAGELTSFGSAALVIEAVVENLDVKRGVMTELESVVGPDALLATNTSSISITAIGAALARPGRLAGVHFFNPAPAMKLVEVVRGLATDQDTVDRLVATTRQWGKIAIVARSTPGFIVNRVARPFYAEALRLIEEQVAEPATIDALAGGFGFRMGPCALMDLIGQDVNYAVTTEIFTAFYGDPRYRPSAVQRELVVGGWLGRKSGRGFYEYGAGATRPDLAIVTAAAQAGPLDSVPLDGATVQVDAITIAVTDGRSAALRAAHEGRPVILHDWIGEAQPGAPLGFTWSPDVPEPLVDRFAATVRSRGFAPVALPDSPGLVAARTVAMIVNEAFDAEYLAVANREDIDLAMTNAVNYPRGPFEWAQRFGPALVLATIDHLYDAYRDPRYRASRGLRRCAATAPQTRASPPAGQDA